MSSLQIKDFYLEYFQRMYFAQFFFLCVDYSVVFSYINRVIGLEIILCIYRNTLQAYNQEDLTLEVHMLLYI